MTKEKFIEKIAKYCQKYAKEFGFKVVSPAIAQACLESAYGTSEKAKHYNYFGLKYKPDRITCNSGYFSDVSKEQKQDGSYITITTNWFNFTSMSKGVKGYYQFINTDNYKKVKEATTPKTYLQAIKDAGYATSIKYVDNVMAVINAWNLTKYDDIKVEEKIPFTNSSLVDCIVKSPNFTEVKDRKLNRITPHCVVGQLKAENIGACFPKGRQASCNYGIGTEGRVCLIVDEKNAAWTSSSSENDQQAITIECASDKESPYAFNNVVYNKLIDLCIDICKRYNKKSLIWIKDKDKALAYQCKNDEMLLTVHRWFKNKSCPGDWMFARMGELAQLVTDTLNGKQITRPVINNTNNSSVKKTAATTTEGKTVNYVIQVTSDALNYRQGPGTNYKVNGVIKDKGRYTIIQENNGWGLLKSKVGWIKLSYTKRV